MTQTTAPISAPVTIDSARHRSGVALRFPRIARLRRDKPAAEADRLETLLRTVAVQAKAA